MCLFMCICDTVCVCLCVNVCMRVFVNVLMCKCIYVYMCVCVLPCQPLLSIILLIRGVHRQHYYNKANTSMIRSSFNNHHPSFTLSTFIEVDGDVKLGAIMRSLFANPTDREAGDKADDEDERLVSRYAEGTTQITQVLSSLIDLYRTTTCVKILHTMRSFRSRTSERTYSSVLTNIMIFSSARFSFF